MKDFIQGLQGELKRLQDLQNELNLQAILAGVPDDEKKMMEDMQFNTFDNVGANYQESIQYPSLNVRGIESGWVREEVRTIVPSECIAEIDVRLVLESDPVRLHNLIKEHIKELGYFIMDRRPTKEERLKYNKIVTFVSTFDYDAFRTDINSDIGKWLVKSLTETFNVSPVKKRTSIGNSSRSRPKNKNKRRQHVKYRGQGHG